MSSDPFTDKINEIEKTGENITNKIEVLMKGNALRHSKLLINLNGINQKIEDFKPNVEELKKKFD